MNCLFIYLYSAYFKKGFEVTCNTRHNQESCEDGEDKMCLKKIETTLSVRVNIVV